MFLANICFTNITCSRIVLLKEGKSMSISAINCVPIKPKASFAGSEGTKEKHVDYDQIIQVTDKAYNKVSSDNYVSSKSIKKPLAIASSLALAALVSYVGGAKIATLTSKVMPKAPEKVVAGLDKVMTKMPETAEHLKSATGKFAKGKAVAGALLNKFAGVAKKGYDKIGGSLEAGAAKNQKVFENIFGIATTASLLPGLLSKDANEDGVSDILQKGQNAYTGAKTNVNDAVANLSLVGELVDILT